MGALTTTRKSTGYQLQFLSPHFFSGKLQRNIDKEILRIKLVLYLGTRWGALSKIK